MNVGNVREFLVVIEHRVHGHLLRGNYCVQPGYIRVASAQLSQQGVGYRQLAAGSGIFGDESLAAIPIGFCAHQLAVVASSEGGKSQLLVRDFHFGVVHRNGLIVGVKPHHNSHIRVGRYRSETEWDHGPFRRVGHLDRVHVLVVGFGQKPHGKEGEPLLYVHLNQRFHLGGNPVLVFPEPGNQRLRVL